MSDWLNNTTAFKIIEQMLLHSWGGEELNKKELLLIINLFRKSGGLWKELIYGDMSQISTLEECINNIMVSKSKLNKIALKISKVQYGKTRK